MISAERLRPYDREDLVMSYVGLRRAIGLLALVLPFVLVIGKQLLDGGPVLNSISAYYYSSVGPYFIGTMGAISVFLTTYRYAPHDDRVSNLLAALGVGVALFPTDTPDPTTAEQVVAAIHRACAAGFLLGLAYFSLFLFTRTDQDPARLSDRKRKDNRVYRASGWTILVAVVLTIVADLTFSQHLMDRLHPVLWLESVSVIAFAIAWLVKGRLIPAP
jgi:hypothetical protein